MSLPPGIVYLGLHLHHFVIPPASVYTISRLAGHFFQLHVPLWAVILASVLSFPAVITFGILYNLHINEREAAKHGAILPPCPPDKYIGGLERLQRNVSSYEHGYIGKGI
jgi:hypothetical protein